MIPITVIAIIEVLNLSSVTLEATVACSLFNCCKVELNRHTVPQNLCHSINWLPDYSLCLLMAENINRFEFSKQYWGQSDGSAVTHCHMKCIVRESGTPHIFGLTGYLEVNISRWVSFVFIWNLYCLSTCQYWPWWRGQKFFALSRSWMSVVTAALRKESSKLATFEDPQTWSEVTWHGNFLRQW